MIALPPGVDGLVGEARPGCAEEVWEEPKQRKSSIRKGQMLAGEGWEMAHLAHPKARPNPAPHEPREQWHAPGIPVLGRQRQEDPKFRLILCCKVSLRSLWAT